MPSYRRVTLFLPTSVLSQAKRMAIRRHISLSKLLIRTLEELAAREDKYARARDRHLAWLEHGADLGTEGRAEWTRESLHEG